MGTRTFPIWGNSGMSLDICMARGQKKLPLVPGNSHLNNDVTQSSISWQSNMVITRIVLRIQ